MYERDMEDAIIDNPERFIGESGLTLISRQYRIGNYIFDLLFEDRHGGKLIVELQVGALDRNHTYKILDYYDEYKTQNPCEFVDLMIIANTVPQERKNRLKDKGIAFKEIPESEFSEWLNLNKNNEISTKPYVAPICLKNNIATAFESLPIIDIPSTLLNEACREVTKAFSTIPFKERGIYIKAQLIKAAMEILNSAENKTLPQNCRNDVRERTPDGLDRQIKEYLKSDLRTANIISDVLSNAGVVRIVSMESPLTKRSIKGTQLKTEWTW